MKSTAVLPDRPLTVLIGALGGQGGGLLADWLVEAAHAAGYPAQATSIPGVAQRTGATTYYFELYPAVEPTGEPVFCLFPSADDVDLVVALEPTEAGRALQQGFVTQRTTVVTTPRRVYSTAEKAIAGDGTVAAPPILAALETASGRLIGIDQATAAGAALNAVMLGAIAGSRVLPIDVTHYRNAIERRGVAIKANLAAFEHGLAAAAGAANAEAESQLKYHSAPVAFAAAVAELPVEVQPMIAHGLARLLDYQNEAYARRYLERLDPLIRLDGIRHRYKLSVEVARRLAAWMSYEDVIRVAQLKTRPGRLQRIRAELGAPPDEPLRVVEYLKPGPRELRAILPPWLARLVREPAANESPGRSLRLPTTSPWGYFALKCLAWLRPLRPHTVGFAREQALIDRWLDGVSVAAKHDYALANQVAELAVWARGYGCVRERGIARLESLLDGFAQRLRTDPGDVAAQVTAALLAARQDPDADCRAAPAPPAVRRSVKSVETTEDIR